MTTIPSQESTKTVDDWTKPPFLRRVRIRGYKSIAFCDVTLQPLTILVGRNASGKSNFLDALAFLRDTMAEGVAEAVKRRGGWGSVASRNTNPSAIEIEIEAGYFCGRPVQRIQIDESGNPALGSVVPMPSLEGHSFSARYSLQVVGGHNSPPVIQRESLDLTDETTNERGGFDLQRNVPQSPAPKSDKKNGGIVITHGATFLHWKGGNVWSVASKQAISTLSPQRSELCLLAVIGFQPFLELSEGLRFMGFYNFIPEAMRPLQRPTFGQLLDQHGWNLASVLDDTRQNDPWAFQRIGSYLSAVVPEVERFDAVRYGEFETIHFWLGSNDPDQKLEFDAASMSDGTLRVLATLMAAFQVVLPHRYPNVVGIEEPETALHPAAMRALVDALDDATQRTQILLTTQSADLLSGRDVSPGQVLIVRNRVGQTIITPVSPASREIIRKELYSLADLQRMDKLDVDEADLKRQAQLSGQGGA